MTTAATLCVLDLNHGTAEHLEAVNNTAQANVSPIQYKMPYFHASLFCNLYETQAGDKLPRMKTFAF